ncbi:cytochrome P450 [Streptomyces sp. NBC_01092]|uniref:cytochrome P450 n=1 Tax=Streptomyces sp. NBC_01092 TaxID=2903748 RepID=UPI00386A6D8C
MRSAPRSSRWPWPAPRPPRRCCPGSCTNSPGVPTSRPASWPSWARSSPERPVTFDDLPRLPYLNRVITETLRLHRTGRLVTRRTTTETRLGGPPYGPAR